MGWTKAAEHEIRDVRFRNVRNDGTVMTTKTGAPMWYAEIQVEAHGDAWIGGLIFKSPADWKGTRKFIQFTEEEYEGKPRLKFRTAQKPKPNPSMEVLIEIRDLLIAAAEQRAKHSDQMEGLITDVQNLTDVVRVAIQHSGDRRQG